MQAKQDKLLVTEKSPIRILIADDHGIVREALSRYLQQQSEFEVIGEAKSGQEVLDKCTLINPDIVIMDISMPQMSGIECAHLLKEKHPKIRILALTSHDDESHLKDCLLAGINAYVLKRSFSEDLKLALLTVYRGGTYIDAIIADKLPALLCAENGTAGVPLSDRETQVLSLIAQGLSMKDVSTQLRISIKTVETYKARSCEKLNIKSRAELVKYAIEHGLLNGAH